MTDQQQEATAPQEANSVEPSPLATALAEVQQHLPKIRKNETGEVSGKTKDGQPYRYTYQYADLADITDEIMPLLGKNGLAFTAAPRFINGQFVLVCELLHESGERKVAEWPLPQQGKPQDLGSAMTYGRRYTLCAMTGVAPGGDDDDAHAAQRAYERAEQAQQEQREPTEHEKAAAELRQAVGNRRLDTNLVPGEFERRYGVKIQHSTPEQVRDYAAFVTQTGSLGDDPWQTGTPDAGEESQVSPEGDKSSDSAE
jgi:hypothetical protein